MIMLLHLSIKDFALIENLELEFTNSTNAFIGESGSGKSLIFDALSVILGKKCNILNIRAGAKKYQIEAIFSIPNFPEITKWLVSKSIPLEGNTLSLKKELHTDGRSKAQINSAIVPPNYLKEVGQILVEIFRQNEQSILQEREKQLEILDSFANLELEKQELKKIFHSYRNLKNQLQQIEFNEIEKQRKREMYEYQIQEIERANLSPEEETNLLQEEKILSQSEKIAENLSLALNFLEGEERDLLSTLIKANSSLEKISNLRNEFSEISQEIMNTYYNLKEIISSLHEELEEIDFSYERLGKVQKRLDEIYKMKKKYSRSIPEILHYKTSLQKELENLEKGDLYLFNLQEELEHKRLELTKKATELSFKRRKAIAEFETLLQKELEDLGMRDSRIQIILRWEASPDGDVIDSGKKYFISENGLDNVEFYFSANHGEKPRPLRKIASGGEISRIMLAVKKILGSRDMGRILIFDEIDAGVSGETALKVAAKLKNIAQNHQVILITHQQAIAAICESQFLVTKKQEGGRTITQVEKISEKEKVEILAKMISGENITKGALEHAKELLKKVAG